MKKLMFAAAVIAAGVAVADVTSANVVGYVTKGARDGFCYFTPTFRAVSGDQAKIDINDIQMGADVTTGAADLQFLNVNGGTEVDKEGELLAYVWVQNGDSKYKGDVDMTGKNGVWAVQVGSGFNTRYYDPDPSIGQPKLLDVGQGIQIAGSSDMKFQNAGQVGTESVEVLTRQARDGFTYFGNPFPVEMDINNIQMDENVTTGAADLQFLNVNGGTEVDNEGELLAYVWVQKGDSKYKGDVDMTGKNGVWAVQVGSGFNTRYYDPDPSVGQPNKLGAGQGIQIAGSSDMHFWAVCPIEL